MSNSDPKFIDFVLSLLRLNFIRDKLPKRAQLKLKVPQNLFETMWNEHQVKHSPKNDLLERLSHSGHKWEDINVKILLLRNLFCLNRCGVENYFPS